MNPVASPTLNHEIARPRLGEILISQQIISADQLKVALTEQKKTQEQLGKILVKLGFVSEAVMRDLLGQTLGQSSIELSKLVVDHETLSLVPKQLARRYSLIPISFDKKANFLRVAMADIFNVLAIDQLVATLGGNIRVEPLLASEAEILSAIDHFYGYNLSLDGILHEIETGEVDYQSLPAGREEYSQPFVRLVDALLSDAVKRGASDIHFEPEKGFLRIRYRLDGVLQQIRSLHKSYWSAIAVRIKVLAGLNIAENRIPQDGRISLTLAGRLIDFRVSVQPTIYGENIVLRILDSQRGLLSLNQLGLMDDSLQTLKLMVARPEGLILITGPTGSGKTTTLYSVLNHLNTEAVNIMTLEDPVEYALGRVRQTAVNEGVKLDFVTGVRSILRQDPDIILVGEIRDEETAEMAFRAAMTGHQVYSTLHTNSAIGAIPRLLDIGVQPDLMADNIIGIIGQRLVRKLCSHCKQPYPPADMHRRLLGLSVNQTATLYRATGCEQCEQRGYKGRLALMEILRLDDGLQELIAHRATTYDIKHHTQRAGFRALAQEGIRRVLEGITSLEEVARVVDLTSQL
ncbi:type II secretory pathway, ATPase PulE/Tfp pilus assembly pathway, ATPase PilB [Beggiatoa alba B18LD]|uniref:Type II secretory pathway, ATPase PulE/Tfp pilus assembly pathway, ATPase PilB n=1 Tax=Beggiatoa alba B18LD TaxID=395493 RepID=I3CJX4_9GAMM|nr:GspE/PulE family protein [Beggiatoa alba]EIJ43917.1 type II secretory pathway, ATPase PulE/Tfp pilus assembly pathway, ATPase PilB [Beggiatoa alba B18LD]